MKIIEVKTAKQLKELYDAWAMTWEGLSEDSFEDALELCCKEGKNGTGYVTTGKTMNEICHLTGDNAYPDDLIIFSIKDYRGLAVAFQARWMYDIIYNNAHYENYHPFKD